MIASRPLETTPERVAAISPPFAGALSTSGRAETRRASLRALGALSLGVVIATATARAQDRLITATGAQEGRIVAVQGANIMFELPGGRGTIGVPLATVRRVEKDAPPEYAKAVQQFQTGEHEAALATLQSLVTKFGGLPTEWAMGASSLLGDTLVALGRYPDAEKAYQSFKTRYPGAAGSERAEVGMARIAVEKKQHEQARTRLQPFADRALKELAPNAAASALYGQVFHLLGQIEEAAGNKPAALENYLRTVTLFRGDASALESAAKRAETLAKDTVVP